MRTLATCVGLTIAAFFAGFCSTASASSIPVANPSFETLPPSGLPIGCGTGCFYGAAAIPGWVNSGFSGQFQPGTQDGNFTYFDSIPNGITVAYSNGPTISQTLGVTVQTAVTYTLQVDLGWRNDYPAFTSSADLLIGGVLYPALGSTPVQGNWSNFTATYTGLPADVGDAITIVLNTSAAQGDFDNVRMSSSVVPEPASLLLVGTGLLGLAALLPLKRRRSGEMTTAGPVL